VAQEKRDESFRVVDRRLFTAEGELREGALEQEEREEKMEKEARAAKAASAASMAPAAPAETPATTGSRPMGGAAQAAAAAAPGKETIAPSRGFQMLVDFLARNAAAMLGGMADPRTGQPFFDLEAAREMIEMLDALREKTMGNLAAEDNELLIEVIGSLKLSFMELSKAAAAKLEQTQVKP
jgi:Domain of unknown function (DUF1844)